MVTTGRAADEILFHLGDFDFPSGFLLIGNFVGGCTEIASKLLGELYVECLVDAGEDLLFNQLLDDEIGLDAEFIGELFNGDAFGNGDLAIDRRRLKNGLAFGNALAKISFLILTFARSLTSAWLGLVAALLFGRYRVAVSGRRLVGCMDAPQTTGATLLLAGRATAGKTAGTAHKRLAGTNGTKIKRPAGSG